MTERPKDRVPPTDAAPPERELRQAVEQRAERRRRAEREVRRGLWSSLGLFGIVGWSVSAPTLAGLAAGIWLDARFPGSISWTVTMLFVGIALGCLIAWHWVRHESREDGHEPRA